MSKHKTALLPCPFCGSNDVSTGGDDKVVGAWCMACQASGPNHYNSHAEWNTRAPQQVPVVSGKHKTAEQWAVEIFTAMAIARLENYRLEPGAEIVKKLMQQAREEAKPVEMAVEDDFRHAYNEGFLEGMREHITSRGGKTWKESKIYQRVQLERQRQPAVQWMPIETAPKDGSFAYVSIPAGEEPAWETQAYWNSERSCWLGMDSVGLRPVKPVKWQPLPAGPTGGNGS